MMSLLNLSKNFLNVLTNSFECYLLLLDQNRLNNFCPFSLVNLDLTLVLVFFFHVMMMIVFFYLMILINSHLLLWFLMMDLNFLLHSFSINKSYSQMTLISSRLYFV